MPAFLAMVEGEEGYVGDVYFVEHAINARRAVCDEWQDGELSGAKVRRMPHFDQYEAQGWVPMRDMAYEGWWSECYNCDVRLTDSEQYDDDDNEFCLNPDDFTGMFGGRCFCSQKCEDEYNLRQFKKETVELRTQDKMRAHLESKFGVAGIEYTKRDDGYLNGFTSTILWKDTEPYVKKASMHFKVPGCQFGLHLDFDLDKGEHPYSVTYHPEDHDCVASFFLERTGRVLDNPPNRN